MESTTSVSAQGPVSAHAFTSAMAAAVAGVNIVTTDGLGGRFGLTVSAMVSVATEPAMLLVSIRRTSPILPAILENGIFGVSVLGSHHDALADTFAGRPRTGSPYNFAAADWVRSPSGVPLLADAAARFDCRVSASMEAGTHTIVLGVVHDVGRGMASPLAYTGRAYARPVPCL